MVTKKLLISTSLSEKDRQATGQPKGGLDAESKLRQKQCI